MNPAQLFPAFEQALLAGRVDLYRDRFKVLLATDVPDPRHSTRADIRNEVDIRYGYEAGGIDVQMFTHQGADGLRQLIATAVTWPKTLIRGARSAIYYVSRGSDPHADELVQWVDFKEPFSCGNGPFHLDGSEAVLSWTAPNNMNERARA